MDWLKQRQTKTQLGQLLLKKKLISEDQLNRAIDLQKSTGLRLGDALTQLGIVSQRQIQDMLKKQRNLRRMLTIVAALWAPVQVYAASTTPVPVEQTETASVTHKQHGLRALNEDELSEMSAQGALTDALSDWLNLNGSARSALNNNLNNNNLGQLQMNNMAKQTVGLEVAGLMMLMDPLLGLLSAQTALKEAAIDPTGASTTVNANGSVTVSLPSSVGDLNFQNIRVMGTTGPSLGSVEIKGIDLAGTTVTVKFH